MEITGQREYCEGQGHCGRGEEQRPTRMSCIIYFPSSSLYYLNKRDDSNVISPELGLRLFTSYNIDAIVSLSNKLCEYLANSQRVLFSLPALSPSLRLLLCVLPMVVLATLLALQRHTRSSRRHKLCKIRLVRSKDNGIGVLTCQGLKTPSLPQMLPQRCGWG